MKDSKKGQNFVMSIVIMDVLFETPWTPCKKQHFSSWSRTRFTFFWSTLYISELLMVVIVQTTSTIINKYKRERIYCPNSVKLVSGGVRVLVCVRMCTRFMRTCWDFEEIFNDTVPKGLLTTIRMTQSKPSWLQSYISVMLMLRLFFFAIFIDYVVVVALGSALLWLFQ